jgi:hypothetical protein
VSNTVEGGECGMDDTSSWEMKSRRALGASHMLRGIFQLTVEDMWGSE